MTIKNFVTSGNGGIAKNENSPHIPADDSYRKVAVEIMRAMKGNMGARAREWAARIEALDVKAAVEAATEAKP
jgi:hypothetical protein